MKAGFRNELEKFIQDTNKCIADIEDGRFEYTYAFAHTRGNMIILTLHDKLKNETEDKYVDFWVSNGINPYDNNKKCKYYCNAIIFATNNMIINRRMI